MAAEDAFDTAPASAEEAVFLNGSDEVMAATGMEAADRSPESGEGQLVEANKENDSRGGEREEPAQRRGDGRIGFRRIFRREGDGIFAGSGHCWGS